MSSVFVCPSWLCLSRCRAVRTFPALLASSLRSCAHRRHSPTCPFLSRSCSSKPSVIHARSHPVPHCAYSVPCSGFERLGR
ncbi:hypothetical protein BD414DRAFT_500680 [Trametes punicea]|nr:hypothetical protein BD414DRAFT_500680 [Trametes punicea]